MDALTQELLGCLQISATEKQIDYIISPAINCVD